MQKRLNIKAFSEKAGYSVATVSRALNQQTASMVKEETRRKIQQLAAQLNFVPHPSARVLRRTNPAPIAVLLPQKEHIFLSEYYGQLLMGILQFTSARGQAVYAMAFKPDPNDFIARLNEVSVGCDGIIYLSDPITTQQVESLTELHQPFVFPTSCLARDVSEASLKTPVFGLDDVSGSQVATEHLISLGHRNIAFLGGPSNKRDAVLRRQGYELAMKKHRLKVRPEWMFEAGYFFQAGFEVARNFRKLMPTVTAVVSASDESALGFMHMLQSEGIHCPRDVSITGFDDLLWASRYTPSLTTIRQPLLEMASTAVEMVTEMQQGNGKRAKIPNRLFKPTLVIRASTAAPNI